MAMPGFMFGKRSQEKFGREIGNSQDIQNEDRQKRQNFVFFIPGQNSFSIEHWGPGMKIFDFRLFG
jgi:hypothetical protein